MGYAAAGACHPTLEVALSSWCAHVEPGDSAMSCDSCKTQTSQCLITYLPANSKKAKTVLVPVSTPDCVVPTPVSDASIYIAAIVALWIAALAARLLIDFFKGPTNGNGI